MKSTNTLRLIFGVLMVGAAFAVVPAEPPSQAGSAAGPQSPLAKPLADFDKLVAELRPSSVVGEPIRVGETTIVPFAKISFGLGGGGAMVGFGGGMGVKTSALGILIVDGDDVRVELFPEEPPAPSLIESLVKAVLEKKVVIWGNGINAPDAASLDEMLPALRESLGGVTFIGNVLNLPGLKGSAGGGSGAKAGPGPSKEPATAPKPTPAAMSKLFAEKKFADALAMDDALLAKNPKDPELHVWRGRILGSMTQSGNVMDMMKYGPEALQEFETAVKLDPKNPDALFGRGVSRIMAPPGFGGDADGAIGDLEAALAIKPTPEGYFYLGEAYKMKGLNEKAAAAYQQALKLRPNDPDAQKALAAIK
jgi:uncharacterized spore protein YtfJ